jgi:hypothetical protein
MQAATKDRTLGALAWRARMRSSSRVCTGGLGCAAARRSVVLTGEQIKKGVKRVTRAR